eukprot:TRINITY_DN14293_c0_g1_i1.p1 TRINITY_DN14293_c0_g1~~TRINITY_DN14293_c0_g1_i1.p1  ORF type:complete len:148 (+),score=25.13 TRINITY_DN14293_c0_g1_i1:40-483(+)
MIPFCITFLVISLCLPHFQAQYVNYQANYWKQQQRGDVTALSCQDKLQGKDLSYYTAHPYVAYLYNTDQRLCGLCVNLTNTRNQIKETFRIVDECFGFPHVGDIEYPKYDGCVNLPSCDQGWGKMDPDGVDYLAGKMNVHIDGVYDC